MLRYQLTELGSSSDAMCFPEHWKRAIRRICISRMGEHFDASAQPTWAISVLAGARSSCRGQECPYFALRQLLPTDQFEGLESPYAVLGACPLWVRSGHQSAIELVRLVPEADVT